MLEILKRIKEMIQKNENEDAIKYIDKILSENKNVNDYMDDLVNNLK